MGVPTVSSSVEDGASQSVQVYCVSLNGCTLCVCMASQDFTTSVGRILRAMNMNDQEYVLCFWVILVPLIPGVGASNYQCVAHNYKKLHACFV